MMATPGMIRRVNQFLRKGLEAAGGKLDNIEASFSPVWFPHRRRKPRPGMLEDAAAKLGVDKSRAIMIGDTIKDLQAATAFGIPCILLATTYTEAELVQKAQAANVTPIEILSGLPAAVDWILHKL